MCSLMLILMGSLQQYTLPGTLQANKLSQAEAHGVALRLWVGLRQARERRCTAHAQVPRAAHAQSGVQRGPHAAPARRVP
jgi:hypothetical protein